MCRSFLNLTVKTALKSVGFDVVTDKNKLASFSWPTVYKYLATSQKTVQDRRLVSMKDEQKVIRAVSTEDIDDDRE